MTNTKKAAKGGRFTAGRKAEIHYKTVDGRILGAAGFSHSVQGSRLTAGLQGENLQKNRTMGPNNFTVEAAGDTRSHDSN